MAQDRPFPVDDSAVERLAAEVIERREGQGEVDLGPYLARLGTAAERARLAELVDAARSVEARLPRRLRTGSELSGRYRILDEIGSGGMGRVFSAIDVQLERKVAVKVMHSIDLGDDEREKLFQRESRLLAALQHPGIVAVHEIGRDGDFAFIVMDFVDGRPLSDVVKSARERVGAATRREALGGRLLDECIAKPAAPGRPTLIEPASWYRSVAAILIEVVRTVEAAHERNIVHRDLKPGNILLLGGGSPVLLDFGLAGQREGTGGAVTEGFYGSAAYLAPEQARSMRVGADPKTDIYQLGLVLYEFLTLERAFSGEELMQTLESIRQGRFVPPSVRRSGVPIELEAICMQCLELEPERRYASARELREDLERYRRGDHPLALRTHRWRRMRSTVRGFTRRRPALTGLVVAAGLSAIAFGTWSWINWNRWPAPAVHFRQVHRTPEGGFDIRAIDDAGTVAPADLLGVQVVNERPTTIYALSVFGGVADEQRFVTPLVPLPSDVAPDSAPRRRPEEGWTLAPGTHELVCSQIEDRPDHPMEGLWVFASRGENEVLGSWMEKLGALDADGHGVPLLRAKSLLGEAVSGTRGGRVAALPAGEFRALQSAFDELVRKGEAGWIRSDIWFTRLACSVGTQPEAR